MHAAARRHGLCSSSDAARACSCLCAAAGAARGCRRMHACGNACALAGRVVRRGPVPVLTLLQLFGAASSGLLPRTAARMCASTCSKCRCGCCSPSPPLPLLLLLSRGCAAAAAAAAARTPRARDAHGRAVEGAAGQAGRRAWPQRPRLRPCMTAAAAAVAPEAARHPAARASIHAMRGCCCRRRLWMSGVAAAWWASGSCVWQHCWLFATAGLLIEGQLVISMSCLSGWQQDRERAHPRMR